MESLMNKIEDNKFLAITAVSSLVALGGVAIYSSMGSKQDEELLPALTEEECLTVMKQIIEKVRIEATRVIRAAENIKQQVKAQGQEIEDSIIMNSFALPHFLQAFQELEAAIYEDNDIDEQELEEAVNFYIDHYNKSVENQEDSPKKTNKVVINHSITKELIEITKRIRIIYKEFGGDIDEDGNAISNNGESKDYSLEEAIELMKSLSTKMLDSTDSFAEDFKENYGVPSTMDEMNQFQEGLLAITESAEKELLAEAGLSQTDFQKILMKYQGSLAIQEVFVNMQQETRMRMAAHGINLM